MSSYSAGGLTPGTGAPARIERLGTCEHCGAPLVRINGGSVEHILTAERVRPMWRPRWTCGNQHEGEESDE